MNQWSLTFLSNHLEVQFEQYWVTKGTRNIIFVVKANIFITICCSIVEFIQGRTFIAGSIMAVCLMMLILYLGTVKQWYHIKYIFSIYTLSGILIPYIPLVSVLIPDGIASNETLGFMMCANQGVRYLQVEKNYVIHLILHLNSISLGTFVIIVWVEFILSLILCIFVVSAQTRLPQFIRPKTIILIISKQFIYLYKLCIYLADIIDRIVEDKLIVFNFNEEQLQFQYELSNQSFRNEFEIQVDSQSSINALLRDIQVYYDQKSHSLSEYLYELFKCHNTQTDIILYKSAYYKQKLNKYTLEVFLQEKHKFKFIVKVQKVDQIKSQNKRQIEFLKFFEMQTTKTMSQIEKIVCRDRAQSGTSMQIITLLKDYHLKIQVINLKILNNYVVTPSVFNIFTMLMKALEENQILYQLESQNYFEIQSDYYIFKVLISILMRYIRQSHLLLGRIVITITTNTNETHVQIQIIRMENPKAQYQLSSFLEIVLGYIGVPESVRITQFQIYFSLNNCLESKWNQFN